MSLILNAIRSCPTLLVNYFSSMPSGLDYDSVGRLTLDLCPDNPSASDYNDWEYGMTCISLDHVLSSDVVSLSAEDDKEARDLILSRFNPGSRCLVDKKPPLCSRDIMMALKFEYGERLPSGAVPAVQGDDGSQMHGG